MRSVNCLLLVVLLAGSAPVAARPTASPTPTATRPNPGSPAFPVERFYRWYLVHQDGSHHQITECQNYFTPEFYSQLTRAYQHDPRHSSNFLDFDPFTNSQTDMHSFKIGRPEDPVGPTVRIPVTVLAGLDGKTQIPISVVVRRTAAGWQIANFYYDRTTNAMTNLRRVNR